MRIEGRVVPCTELYLKPGQWHFGKSPDCIRTTLGSCIAMTVWHPHKRLGGMCHFMLSHRMNRDSATALDGRYADEAFQLMAKAALDRGILLRDCEIKLIGAADMLSGPDRSGSRVATDNIDAAHLLAKQYRLRVVAESLGGHGFRQVIFCLMEGKIWIRHGKASADKTKICLES